MIDIQRIKEIVQTHADGFRAALRPLDNPRLAGLPGGQQLTAGGLHRLRRALMRQPLQRAERGDRLQAALPSAVTALPVRINNGVANLPAAVQVAAKDLAVDDK